MRHITSWLRRASFTLTALALLTPVAASAQEYFVISGGIFNGTRAFNQNNHQDSPGQLDFEYRGNEFKYGILPIAGVMINSDLGGYAYAGLNWDLHVSDRVIFTPSFAAGLYARGDGHNMGGPIEFRSGLELSILGPVGSRWEKDRFGLQFNHISNASIYDHNPGAESYMLMYGMPF